MWPDLKIHADFFMCCNREPPRVFTPLNHEFRQGFNLVYLCDGHCSYNILCACSFVCVLLCMLFVCVCVCVCVCVSVCVRVCVCV